MPNDLLSFQEQHIHTPQDQLCNSHIAVFRVRSESFFRGNVYKLRQARKTTDSSVEYLSVGTVGLRKYQIQIEINKNAAFWIKKGKSIGIQIFVKAP
jgi:hypothetical protein